MLLSSGLRNVSVSFWDCTFTGNQAFKVIWSLATGLAT